MAVVAAEGASAGVVEGVAVAVAVEWAAAVAAAAISCFTILFLDSGLLASELRFIASLRADGFCFLYLAPRFSRHSPINECLSI